ncbi:MAG: molybdopterin-synthase adenylyltransferase MoeB [Longimicrobiales bacterium]|nr:molybdopterin-synthase adenylyltransferase MoeB [Longimicrobiales bacterium]
MTDHHRLTTPETLRYARHLSLKEVGPEGQARLKATRVLVVGAGGLGSPAALYLAAAGVGTLGVVEDDVVELSNLQRQVLHGTAAVGRPKLESARARLRDLNPHVAIEPYPVRLDSGNALDILRRYQVVVDGSDNFPTRYLVNDACVLLGIPYVYGSILRWEGQVSLFALPGGPCYRCLFREPPPPELVPSCAEAGVFGALPGVVGSLQALEAIKHVLGVGRSLAGRLLLYDALEAGWREVAVRRDPLCPVCGDEPTVTGLIDYERFCGTSPAGSGVGRPAPTTPDAPAGAAEEGFPHSLAPREMRALLRAPDPPLLVDVRESWEWREGNLAALGALHVPFGDLPGSLERIPRDRALVLVCSMGARSAGAARFLRDRGYPRAANLAGGLRAWVREVDPDLVVA